MFIGESSVPCVRDTITIVTGGYHGEIQKKVTAIEPCYLKRICVISGKQNGCNSVHADTGILSCLVLGLIRFKSPRGRGQIRFPLHAGRRLLAGKEEKVPAYI